jgi:hypothetical protein
VDAEFIAESVSVTVAKLHKSHELAQTGKKREVVAEGESEMESCACLCTLACN